MKVMWRWNERASVYGVEQQRVQINFNNLTPFVDFGFAYGALASRPARVKTARNGRRFRFLLSNDAHDDYTRPHYNAHAAGGRRAG